MLFHKKYPPNSHTNCTNLLLHGPESQVFSPAQSTKIGSLHYNALCQIFTIKSPYTHPILTPSDFPCSHDFLLSLSYPILPSCIPSSMRISDCRICYVGHIFQHPRSVESIIVFHSSFSRRIISSPFRRGAPRAHWPEITLAEGSIILNSSAPVLGQFSYDSYNLFAIAQLKNFHHSSITNWYEFFYQLQKVETIGHFQRTDWNRQPTLDALLRTCSSIGAAYRFGKNMYLLLYIYI